MVSPAQNHVAGKISLNNLNNLFTDIRISLYNYGSSYRVSQEKLG